MTDDIFSLGELFEKAQMQNVFPDGKTFVDCIPHGSIRAIHARYEEEKNKNNFDLAGFINEHFSLPEKTVFAYTSSTERPIVNHIEMLWEELARVPKEANDSTIPLPFPYIVPGGRFREIYYWDSYFTMLGLLVSGRVLIIQSMIDNFSYLIDRIGYIPNGNRTYYIGRSQPPFYACMVKLLSEEKGENILVDYLPQLGKEYIFWMKGSERLNTKNLSINHVALLPDGSILNHYWDENDTPRPESFREDAELAHGAKDKKILHRHLRAGAESGWDFSSRWFKGGNIFSSIHTTEIIPVDLNCLLLHLEETLAEAYELSDNISLVEKYKAAAANRKESIDKYCWNKEQGFYFDYDYIEQKQKASLTLAAAYPLFFGIASQEQADAVAKKIEALFLFPGGLITTTETTSQQWDAPNGWAPLHWLTVKGLSNYNHNELAKEIAIRWMNINEKVYRNTGKMMEKYNVVDIELYAGGGEYPAQDGFGWTNGVYLALNEWLNSDINQVFTSSRM